MAEQDDLIAALLGRIGPVDPRRAALRIAAETPQPIDPNTTNAGPLSLSARWARDMRPFPKLSDALLAPLRGLADASPEAAFATNFMVPGRIPVSSFRTDRPWYHGTHKGADFSAFDPEMFGNVTRAQTANLGTWFTSSRSQADAYGRMAEIERRRAEEGRAYKFHEPGVRSAIYQAHEPANAMVYDVPVEAAKVRDADPSLAAYSDMDIHGPMSQWVPDLVNEAKSRGHDALILRGIRDDPRQILHGGESAVTADHMLVFDPDVATAAVASAKAK